MTCREASEFLLEYVDGELEPAVRVEFEVHVQRCPNCEQFVAQYRTTIVAGRAAFPHAHSDATTAFPPEVVQAILAALAKQRST